MSGEPVRSGHEPELDAQFRNSRVNSLIELNLNTFWSIAIILLGFGLWDAFVDAAHWREAFVIRVAGAVLVVATGVFQKLPGRGAWLPALAKFRLVVAAVSAVSDARARLWLRRRRPRRHHPDRPV